MPFTYKEHTGEAWLVGMGESLEEAFAEGAKALFNLMVELERVEPRISSRIECRSHSIETLFVDWLNALILKKDAEGMVYARFEVQPLRRSAQGYQLEALAWGEAFDPAKHDPKVDAKAATYSELRLQQSEEGYQIECVVDL